MSLLGQSLQISAAQNSANYLPADLSGSSIQVKEPNGTVINSGDYDTVSNDPSFKVYPLQNGEYIVRENIANFVLFDSFGSVIGSISNNGQSEYVEKISELPIDPNGKAIVTI